MRLKIVTVAVMAFMLLGGVALAATSTANLTISATVNARAKLTLSSTTLTFPDADPDVTAAIPAQENTVSVSSKIRSAGACDLKVLATDDLKAGTKTIAIGNVTWTATGSGYQAGAMNKTTPQTVGSWVAGSSGIYAGTLSFFLANSWSYAPGSYTATVTFTLTAP